MFQALRTGLSNLVKNVTSIKPMTLSLLNKQQIDTLKSPFMDQQTLLTPLLSQIRSNWGYKGRMMLKDIKRRELLKKFAPERIRLQTLRGNSILPKVLKKAAEEQLQRLSRHSTLKFVTNRCILTSKAGGCIHPWRLSRHVWRIQADYNQMSGVTRAVWGVKSKKAVMFSFRKAKRNWFNYDGIRLINYTDVDGSVQKQRFKLI